MSKRFLLLLIGMLGAGLVLFIWVWRADQPPRAWQTYHSAEYLFSFQYPSGWSSTCCPLDGPVAPTSELVVSIADAGTLLPDASAPFEGVSVYVDENWAGLAFREYLAHEQDDQYAMRLGLGWRTFPISARAHLSPQAGMASDYVLGGQHGIRLNNYTEDTITRIYVPFPADDKFLILAVPLGIRSEWDDTLEKIFATWRFE